MGSFSNLTMGVKQFTKVTLILFLVMITDALQQEPKYSSIFKRVSLNCPRLGESCSGFPACCGRNQCYYESGYGPFKSGVCVRCVDEGQPCQFHDNCCDEMICSKTSDFGVN